MMMMLMMLAVVVVKVVVVDGVVAVAVVFANLWECFHKLEIENPIYILT